jgi:hypothetical protein
MPVLSNYNEFEGRHWETGTARNFWAYRGIKAPHTGQPYSEALLMGVSGGIVMAYFSFQWEQGDPQARILTRNTFDPMPRMLERLGVIQHMQQTSQPTKGLKNLLDTLEEGTPAIVWADAFTMPWTATIIPIDEMWWMAPMIVYGYDEAADTVWIADRAAVPLTCTTTQLADARARVKKDKFRLLTLDPPQEEKLTAAVQKGIWDCIKLFTEAPPKGGKDSFGFAAYRRLAEVLTKPKHRISWDKEFPPGRKLYAALTWLYSDIMTFGHDGSAERDTYANFLDEAALILDKPALKNVAQQFRRSGQEWCILAEMVLPDDVPLLKETRDLMQRKHRLFIDQGSAATPKIHQIDTRLAAIKTAVAADFPMDAAEITALKERMAAQVMRLHDLESDAIASLQEAMS